MESLRRLLVSLEFPNPDDIDIADRDTVIRMICWLEDRKIR
jgi:hypothetical protein